MHLDGICWKIRHPMIHFFKLHYMYSIKLVCWKNSLFLNMWQIHVFHAILHVTRTASVVETKLMVSSLELMAMIATIFHLKQFGRPQCWRRFEATTKQIPSGVKQQPQKQETTREPNVPWAWKHASPWTNTWDYTRDTLRLQRFLLNLTSFQGKADSIKKMILRQQECMVETQYLYVALLVSSQFLHAKRFCKISGQVFFTLPPSEGAAKDSSFRSLIGCTTSPWKAASSESGSARSEDILCHFSPWPSWCKGYCCTSHKPGAELALRMLAKTAMRHQNRSKMQ